MAVIRTTGIGNANAGFHFQQGTIRYMADNVKAFIIQTPAALTTQDADSAGEVDQGVELILREIQPLVYYSAATSANVTVICDSGQRASDLEARVQSIGNVLTSGGWANLSVATVDEATSLTAAI